MEPHRLSREDARRIAVRAQWLDEPAPDRPAGRDDLVATVRQLTFLQLDPTAAVAPSADLVAYTRLGSGYRPAQLTEAVETDRTLYEHRAFVRPMSDLVLHRPAMLEWGRPGSPYARAGAWLDANERFRAGVLDQLRAEGPLLSRDIPDRAEVPWPSTGWTDNRNVTQLLEFLSARGEVAISGRRGRQRVWDLAERVYPLETEVLDQAEAIRRQDERRLSSLGIARPTAVGSAGEPAEVAGVSGPWRVDPAALDQPFAGRTALLSPFDRLIHDRQRALDLFDFTYKLEMYVPKAKRVWGYFALPVLHHDQLVGKVDATADRKASVLRVAAIHPDVRLTRQLTSAVRRELVRLGRWLQLDRVDLPSSHDLGP